MKEFFIFLKSKLFYKHLAVAIITLMLAVWCIVKFLDIYTHHSETAQVPNFKGKLLSELDNFIEGKNVRYTIIDSIYDPTEKSGIVVKQDPEEKTLVKHNRIIYLYVTSNSRQSISYRGYIWEKR